MLKRYGEKALEQTPVRADELASDGDHDGAATWRRIANAIVQLANKTPPGPGIRRKAEPAALQRAPNSPEHGTLQVRCPALTRPSADIIATAADDPKPTLTKGEVGGVSWVEHRSASVFARDGLAPIPAVRD